MLPEHEKIFFEKKIWEHCKIDVKKIGAHERQLKFKAVIFYKKPANEKTANSSLTFYATFVSFISTLCCIV